MLVLPTSAQSAAAQFIECMESWLQMLCNVLLSYSLLFTHREGRPYILNR
jgi:hypothetical protein